MTILIILAVLIIIGAVMELLYFLDGMGNLLLKICMWLLLGLLIYMPLNRIEINSKIAEYEITKQTVINARANNISLESVAIQHKLIELNQWLAKTKYYNETVFDIWIPDKIMEIEIIK